MDKSTTTKAAKPTSAASQAKAAKNKRKKENAKKNKMNAAAKALEEDRLSNQLAAMNVEEQSSRIEQTSKTTSTKLAAVSVTLTSGTEPQYALPEPYGSLFEIKSSPGKELGMFALQSIKANTEILREAALLQTHREWLCIEAGFNMLTPDKKNRFLALEGRCNCKKQLCMETPIMKIFDTNSFDITPDETADGKRYTYLYEIASRLNHSCNPNAKCGFTKDHHISIRAIHDIVPGQEITHDYVGASLFDDRSFRRKSLSSRYGFLCLCPECSVPANNEDHRRSSPSKFDNITDLLYTWKEMRKFVAENPNATVLGVHTEEELSRFREVTTWYKDITSKLNIGETEILLKVMGSTLRGDCDSEEEVLSASFEWFKRRSMAIIDENNNYNLGAAIWEAYLHRTFPTYKNTFLGFYRKSGPIVDMGNAQQKIDRAARIAARAAAASRE